MPDAISKLNIGPGNNGSKTNLDEREVTKFLTDVRLKHAAKLESRGFSSFLDTNVLASRVKSLTAGNTAGTTNKDTEVTTVTGENGQYFNRSSFRKALNLKGTYHNNIISQNNNKFVEAVCGTAITNEISTIATGSLSVKIYKAYVESCEDVIMNAENEEALMAGLMTVLQDAKEEVKDLTVLNTISNVILSGAVPFAYTGAPTQGVIPWVMSQMIEINGSKRFSGSSRQTIIIGRGTFNKLWNQQSTTGDTLNSRLVLNPDAMTTALIGGVVGNLGGTEIFVDNKLGATFTYNTTTKATESIDPTNTPGAGEAKGEPIFIVHNNNLHLGSNSDFDYQAQFTPQNSWKNFTESEYAIGGATAVGATVWVPSLTTYTYIA
jgi:hypothetical protein